VIVCDEFDDGEIISLVILIVLHVYSKILLESDIDIFDLIVDF